MDQRKHKGHLLKHYYRNMLKPGGPETSQEYRETVFLPYVINQLRNGESLDVVWDRYLPTNLKDSARSKRGKDVEASDRTPGSQKIGQPP